MSSRDPHVQATFASQVAILVFPASAAHQFANLLLGAIDFDLAAAAAAWSAFNLGDKCIGPMSALGVGVASLLRYGTPT